MRFIRVFAFLVVAVATVSASNVLELNEKNFDQLIVNGGKPSLVEVSRHDSEVEQRQNFNRHFH
jgi:hypothetical protein